MEKELQQSTLKTIFKKLKTITQWVATWFYTNEDTKSNLEELKTMLDDSREELRKAEQKLAKEKNEEAKQPIKSEIKQWEKILETLKAMKFIAKLDCKNGETEEQISNFSHRKTTECLNRALKTKRIEVIKLYFENEEFKEQISELHDDNLSWILETVLSTKDTEIVKYCFANEAVIKRIRQWGEEPKHLTIQGNAEIPERIIETFCEESEYGKQLSQISGLKKWIEKMKEHTPDINSDLLEPFEKRCGGNGLEAEIESDYCTLF